ncbi:MAG: hypothetical protein ACLTAS_14735 [Butyribacter sp.]
MTILVTGVGGQLGFDVIEQNLQSVVMKALEVIFLAEVTSY